MHSQLRARKKFASAAALNDRCAGRIVPLDADDRRGRGRVAIERSGFGGAVNVGSRENG
jgi:hypothetical protein